MAETMATAARAEERSKSPVVVKSPSLFGKSPGYPAFNANDDELERQQFRAAKAAATRKALLSDLQAASSNSGTSRESRELSSDRIVALYQNCIKLATENKINQKNTWDLKLIDHITDIVKADTSANRQTNFQKASCTLEAGVKIYSYRVDSVHSETFKVLSGLNRSSLPDEGEDGLDAQDGQPDAENASTETWKKASLSTTLEPSFEALNLKKFDAAYAVDPLFHQTSAQFDEGGASGLLLYNLNVGHDLRILFDSVEVERESSRVQPPADSVTLDLSKHAQSIDLIIEASENLVEISPALADLLGLVNDPRREATSGVIPEIEAATDFPLDEFQAPEQSFPCLGTESLPDGDDDFSAHEIADDWCNDSFASQHDAPSANFSEVVSQQSAADWLIFSMGLTSAREHAWAGPKHWQFSQHPDQPTTKVDKQRQKKSSDKAECLDFSRKPQVDWSLLQKPLKARDINLPKAGERAGTNFLPPKHSIDLSSFACLTLKSEYGLHSRLKQAHQQAPGPMEADFPAPSFFDMGDEDNFSADGDHEPPDWSAEDMVTKPRTVEKVEVTYAKRSKQVDVKALKDTIWSLLTGNSRASAGSDVSLKETLQLIPSDCPAAPISDISVHLCFISLLHLANENSLVLQAPPTMDEVHVSGFPSK